MLDVDRLTRLSEPFGLCAEKLRSIGCSQNEVFEHDQGDDRRILRASQGRGRNVEKVEAELDWVECLARLGVPVCRPLPSIAGRRCERIEYLGDQYIVACFTRAPGRKIGQDDLGDPLFAALGRLTARLHAASFDELSAGFKHAASTRPVWYESRLLTDDLHKHTPAGEYAFRGAVRTLIEVLKPLVADQLGLVHADISLSNTFLDGDQLWIFDFDNCEIGSVVQDLATILYDSIYCRVLNRIPPAELSLRIQGYWQAFLSGYLDVRTLKSLDSGLLRKFLILREAVIYIHYCRVLDPTSLTDSWREGMNEMRLRVEQGATQIELREWQH